MLRVLQTNAFADKVVKLFETLTPKFNFQPIPAGIEANPTSRARTSPETAALSAARRRRLRSRRLAGATGTIRSSWF